MTVFELMATLGLDTKPFEEGLDAAKTGSTQASADIEKTFDSLDDATTNFDTQLDDLKTKSDETSAIMEGVSQSIGDIVKDAIEGIIEFGKQSIEAAASTGSELAVAFNASRDSFNLNLDIFKEKTGEALLPIMTWLYDVGSAITGIDDTDRLVYLNRQMEELQNKNLENVMEQLSGVFGLFEQVDAVEAGDVSGLAEGLQSQADYWTDYAETLESLKNKGIDAGFLAEIADGSVQSLETLKSLEGADATALEEITTAYDAVQAAKESAATGLNEAQLQVDTDLKAMVDDVAELVAGMDKSSEAYQNALATGGGVVDGLAAQYPAIASWVDSINAKIAEIGMNQPFAGGGGASAAGKQSSGIDWAQYFGNVGTAYAPHASGLDYVPYNDYRANLHAGEAVLTRQEAEAWRAGADRSGLTADDVAQAVASALDGVSVNLGDQIVGVLSTRVSRDIAKKTRVTKRYATT